MKITKIEAHEILDSRGNPTLKTTVVLEDGSTGWAAVPSGASTGKYEAHELRDKDEKRYLGMGVLKAIDNVHGDIAKVIAGIDAEDQKTLVLQNILKEEGLATTAGDEGGYATNLDTNEAALHFISQAVERAGYVLGKDIYLGMDAAASELKSDGGYWLRKEEKSYSSTELAVIYDQFKSKYPIISMEDIFDQDDWESFKNYTEKNGNLLQIVGDDLYTTNVLRIKKGIETKATNAVLIKPNQIGTLTETIEAILLAKDNNLSAIISHRSGETEDPFIADLAVAMGCSQIKTGAPCRSERTVKYNRLMHIERKVGDKGTYASFPFHPQ